jgi:integrase
VSEPHSTPGPEPAKPTKPAKPYPEFPLTAHPAGYWCKKIRGKLHYFGPWDDPDGALKKYLEQKDALHAGRTPRPDPAALTVKAAANAFLNAKQALVGSGELQERTFAEYRDMAEELVAHTGKQRLVSDLGPEDFARLRDKLASKWGPVRLKKAIGYVGMIFRHAYEAGLIDRPVRFGPGFRVPSRKVLRLHRAERGLRMFEAEEIRQMLAAASPQLKAMILLGINAGLGNADCGRLPLSALDLERGWLTYPRPKTGVARRCPLWPETVEAIRGALAERPDPKDKAHAGLVFVTKFGLSWAKGTTDNPISSEVRKLLDLLGINGHRNFYALRHTFETVGGEAKDQVAVDAFMGHARDDMASLYRERIGDERLKAVANHVRAWLFPKEKLRTAGPPADDGETGRETL